MTTSMYVSLEEMLTDTGLTRRQFTNDLKAGLFPGRIVRRQPRVLRSEWDAYKSGEWQPRTAPVPFLHAIKSKAS